MKKLLLMFVLVVALALSAMTATAQAVSYNTGWVCQYLNHPAPVPYGNGYLFCIGDYRWHFVGP